MIKYVREQFFLSANELVNSLQSKNSKSYWTFVKRLMKGTGNNYNIPTLYNVHQVNWYTKTRQRPIFLNNIFALLHLLMILIESLKCSPTNKCYMIKYRCERSRSETFSKLFKLANLWW